MNTLKIYPKKFRKVYEQNIKYSGISQPPERYHNLIFIITIIVSALLSVLFFFLNVNTLFALGVFIFLNVFFYFKTSIKASARIKQMENNFPDVISLTASNLRAGTTIEKAFLLSARPEFAPLDEEILRVGKDISTGKDVVSSLKSMREKVNSEKISKVIELIISGLRAGGNIADLLEQTSRNMKENEIIERKIASTTLMYVIFIFFAVSIGAPVLFGLSSVLVEIVINLAGRMPELNNVQMGLPFTFSKLTISLNFVIYFALGFIILTDFISCFVIGIVNRGEGKSGLKFFIPILIISLTLFFGVRAFLSKMLVGAISSF